MNRTFAAAMIVLFLTGFVGAWLSVLVKREQLPQIAEQCRILGSYRRPAGAFPAHLAGQ